MSLDTHSQKRPPSGTAYPKEFLDLSRHLPYHFGMLTNLIRRATTEVFIQKSKLSGREWRVLCMIGIKGPLQPAEVADLTGMDRATITRAADRLSAMGFIERLKDAQDGRKVTLHLTTEGAAKCDKILPQMRERGQRFETVLSAEELTTLYEILNKIQQTANQLILEDARQSD